MRKGNETRDVVKPILDYCNKVGIFAKRRNVAGVQRMHGHFVKFGEKGQSDIWGILPNGKHFECECKLPGEVPTESQLEWLKSVPRSSLAFWVTSPEEFIEIVERNRN